MHLQNALPRLAKRKTTERDYTAWLGVRALADSAMRSHKTTPQELKAFLLSDQFKLEGFKGQALTFRTWDHQMRQPIILGGGTRVPVSTSPQEGFLHEKNLTDTLGFDRAGDQVQIPLTAPRGNPMFRLALTASLAAVLMLTASHAFAMTIFVSNEKDNTITVIDGDTLEIKKTIKVARRPRGIVLSPDFKELFVAAGDGDIMDVIDTQTLEVKRQLESGPGSRADGRRSQGRGHLHRQRGRFSRHHHGHQDRRGAGRGAGRRRA